MKKRIFLPGILLLFWATVVFFACSKSYDSPGGGGDIPTNTIYMRGSIFSNPNLIIALGTRVTWVNDDNMSHTVTENEGAFDSGEIMPGKNYSFTFNAIGTYNYHCTLHTGMTGVVTVATR